MSRKTATAQAPTVDSLDLSAMETKRRDFEAYLEHQGETLNLRGAGGWKEWDCGCRLRSNVLPLEAAAPQPCDQHRKAVGA